LLGSFLQRFKLVGMRLLLWREWLVGIVVVVIAPRGFDR
jgi:hypothetical protein